MDHDLQSNALAPPDEPLTSPRFPSHSPEEHPPLISEDNFNQEAWDAWYREQIRLSIEDPRPNIPHEEIERNFWADCRAYRSTHGCSNGS